MWDLVVMKAVWDVGPGLPAADGATEASPAAAADGGADVDEDDEASLCGTLFRGLVFFLGREVPREALLLAIRCASDMPSACIMPHDSSEVGPTLSLSIRKPEGVLLLVTCTSAAMQLQSSGCLEDRV